MGAKHPWKVAALALSLGLLVISQLPGGAAYEKNPRFELKGGTVSGAGETLFEPKNAYNIFINYELGMHCVGFDITYCCVIPPYNSIQAQAVRAGRQGGLPLLLAPSDKVKLRYFVRDNSYSEGNKMRYWSALKDVNGDGTMSDPNDNMANYVWTHLFIYKDLAGTLPPDWTVNQRLHVGRQVPVAIDHGPSGMPLAGGDLVYSGPKGGNIVFTDTLIPAVKNVPLTLTSSYLWDALGLPLTAFYDSRRQGTIRTVVPADFQPFQYATVRLEDEQGRPVSVGGRPVEFFGTDPVDLPSCYACHSGQGPAAQASRRTGLTIFDKEYDYWKKNYPDESEFMARLSAASVDILELHDKAQGTQFLKDYQAGASSNRLGAVGSVNCADCHGDNISGNLQTPRPGVTGYKPSKGPVLTEAIHRVHMKTVPLPDGAGRTMNCQACHPMHWQNPALNDLDTNPFDVINDSGQPRFSNGDQRTAGGGCYLRRDSMTNPRAEAPFFLNAIGHWFLENVSLRDEKGNPVSEMRGLTCTNCHNLLSEALTAADNLKDVVLQEGATLRNKKLPEIIKAVAGGDAARFADYFADPKVQAQGDPLLGYYAHHTPATMVKAAKDEKGNLKLLPWNASTGDAVPYLAATGGSDWWLAAAEPHCANCHKAPFVESNGGHYFPIDQPNRYSLYRYSKAHANLACQSCHQSIHGTYPVRYEGEKDSVDVTTHEQALQFSPDGRYAGPVTCAACHTVNAKGVPVQLKGTGYYEDHWAAVVLLHFMRGNDHDLPVKDLVKKYPYARSSQIVAGGWK
jgi:mono/diheme cytochrome c family protein